MSALPPHGTAAAAAPPTPPFGAAPPAASSPEGSRGQGPLGGGVGGGWVGGRGGVGCCSAGEDEDKDEEMAPPSPDDAWGADDIIPGVRSCGEEVQMTEQAWECLEGWACEGIISVNRRTHRPFQGSMMLRTQPVQNACLRACTFGSMGLWIRMQVLTHTPLGGT